MEFNPEYYHRRSIRLKGYDYSMAGLYYITICCYDRICRFGAVKSQTMVLNELGKIAHDEWIKLAQRFSNFELDVFQIMPNHIHAIISLNDTIVGAGLAPAHDNAPVYDNSPAQNNTPTIGAIIGAYKSLVSNACLEIFKSKNETMGKLFQRNYYEHIIRDEISLNNITEYIINNPQNWHHDELYN